MAEAITCFLIGRAVFVQVDWPSLPASTTGGRDDRDYRIDKYTFLWMIVLAVVYWYTLRNRTGDK